MWILARGGADGFGVDKGLLMNARTWMGREVCKQASYSQISQSDCMILHGHVFLDLWVGLPALFMSLSSI